MPFLGDMLVPWMVFITPDASFFQMHLIESYNKSLEFVSLQLTEDTVKHPKPLQKLTFHHGKVTQHCTKELKLTTSKLKLHCEMRCQARFQSESW